jgi:outer membrane protein OmpA-like peptidoglycan-associated protein
MATTRQLYVSADPLLTRLRIACGNIDRGAPMFNGVCLMAVTAAILGGMAALAQAPAPAKAPDSLSIFFACGSAAISPEAESVLDQAARTYRDGKPIIMVVAGGSDATGSPAGNLRLSQHRAENVLQGLVARGIPVERFQVLAKGETEPAVPDPQGTPEARNRRVEISWR